VRQGGHIAGIHGDRFPQGRLFDLCIAPTGGEPETQRLDLSRIEPAGREIARLLARRAGSPAAIAQLRRARHTSGSLARSFSPNSSSALVRNGSDSANYPSLTTALASFGAMHPAKGNDSDARVQATKVFVWWSRASLQRPS
jgi:hypothetical protein